MPLQYEIAGAPSASLTHCATRTSMHKLVLGKHQPTLVCSVSLHDSSNNKKKLYYNVTISCDFFKFALKNRIIIYCIIFII